MKRFASKELDMCRDYFLAGGMPESVVSRREKKDPGSCMKIQQDLLAMFRDDFHKYGAKFDPLLLGRLLASSDEQSGGKFVYSRVDPEKKVGPVKEALEIAVRMHTGSPRLETVDVKTTLGAPVQYRLLSVPIYLAERLDRLVEQASSM